MKQVTPVVRELLEAMIIGDMITLDRILCTDACLEVWHHDDRRFYWTRPRVRNALLTQAARWQTPSLDIQNCILEGNEVIVHFQVWDHDGSRTVSHKRSIRVMVRGEFVEMIKLYCDKSTQPDKLIWSAPHLFPNSAFNAA